MKGIEQGLTTEEELFCTRYERDILSGIVNEGRLERWLPGFCSDHTHKEHVLRYEWVKDFVRGKTVLDIACGAGFGSLILARDGQAAQVTGLDIDENTVRYASLRNQRSNLAFETGDAETFDATARYHVIVSFETIEHLRHPEAFLKNINRALTPGGICFISTPISAMPENNQPDNIYHQREWGFKKFRELVKGFLNIHEVYLQLYKARESNAGFFSKVLFKTGLKHSDPLPLIEKLVPHKWNPQELKEDAIGLEWTGYQIVQCTKKNDAGT